VPSHLRVLRGRVRIDGTPWVRAAPRSIQIVALGKAAAPLADAAVRALGGAVRGAVAAVGAGYGRPHAPVVAVTGEHPVPGAGSIRAGRALIDAIRSTPEDAPILFLISGGGSAIAELPAPGLALADLRTTTRALLASGAPIGAANVLRRHLSELKGGGLARAAGPRPQATLAISDVLRDVPWDIAGGPTVPDPTTFRDAVAVVRRYRLGPKLPVRVLRHLQAGLRGEVRDTWKPDRARPEVRGFHLLGSNALAQEAAVAEARRRGYRVRRIEAPVTGEAHRVGARLGGELVRGRRRATRPEAWISGGETTVTLGRENGRGGRNEELALGAVPVLDGTNGVLLLALATDGVDGSSGAAGALVDGRTARSARRLGISIPEALRRHDADPALARLKARWATGPTGTNVSDLQIRLLAPRTGSSPRRGAASSSRRRRSSAADSR